MTSTETTIILSAAVSLAGIFAFLSTWLITRQKIKVDGSTVSSEVISAFKVQVEQLKDQRIEDKKNYDSQRAEDKRQYDSSVINFTNQVNTLSTEVGRLNGVVSEKDKQILKYEQIFQNRDPDLLAAIKDMKDSMKDIKDFMIAMQRIMMSVDERTQKSEERDLKIDNGHVLAAKVVVADGK